MAVGYNSYNYLLKVKAVCEIYEKHSRRGIPNTEIYANYIKDVFFISKRTFYNYLTVPYKKELQQYENNNQ